MASIETINTATTLSSVSTNKTFTSGASFGSYLLDASNVSTAKPSIKEFMDATGASWDEAQVVYVNDTIDTRDWEKIMASDDPLKSARLATAEFYSADERDYQGGYVPNNNQIYAETEHFTYYKDVDGNNRLAMSDSNGVLLRELTGDAENVKNNVLSFGFDLLELENLQTQLEQKGIDSPLFGDTEKNVFLDVKGIAAYAQNQTPLSAYVISSVDKYTARPTIYYTQMLYPSSTASQGVVQTSNTASNIVSSSMLDTSGVNSITGLYQSYLKREPDAEGLAFWTEKLNEGATLQEIERAFYLSNEFKNLNNTTKPATTNTSISLKNATLEDLLQLI